MRRSAPAERTGSSRRTASFRFHGELRGLARGLRGDGEIEQRLAEHATIKHAIEALDVPHTEIGAVAVDGRDADLAQQLAGGEHVDVYPPPARASVADGEPRFVADAHLGALARGLRLLGFDTVLAGDGADHAIAELADTQARILLSRDRELLKHRRVGRGRLLRALRPDDQLVEVLLRFGLRDAIRPFTRCLECNAPLRAARRCEVEARLPPRVAEEHGAFTVCHGCGRVYWPGSHWRRLSARIAALRERVDEARAPGAPGGCVIG